jgi:hypothetical protein
MEASTMWTAPSDDNALLDSIPFRQDPLLVMRRESGVVRYLLASEPAGLTATLEADALDDEARFVIATCINTEWFEFNDLLGYLARLPTDRGAGRAGRRRREREGS